MLSIPRNKILLNASLIITYLVAAESYNILLIGGTRFSGAYVWKELYKAGHSVTVYNRGKTEPKPVANESRSNFYKRMAAAQFLEGDRTDPTQIKALVDPTKYEYVYDMNARKMEDTATLAELFANQPNFKQYVFMSSAGVYLPSDEMPHLESNPTDPNSRHKGKLDCEAKLASLGGLPWCSFRPTYICGPQNYNPVERYFFERVTAGRPVCIPGHGQHFTGLGHVQDLAVAFVNVIGREHKTTGKVYNVQNTQAITFDGVARAAAKAAGVDPDTVPIVHYDPKDYTFPEEKKAFPMRPQHFFTGIYRAMEDLDWKPQYDTVESIMKDSYENDFVHVKASGGLKNDFECDDIVLAGGAGANLSSLSYAGSNNNKAAAPAAPVPEGPKADWMQNFDDRAAREAVKNTPKNADWMMDTKGGAKLSRNDGMRKRSGAGSADGDFRWS